MNSLDSYLQLALKAAEAACQTIMKVYGRDDFQVQDKADLSPITAADQASHQQIKEILAPSDLPFLSEEGREIPYAERKDWHRFWLVDPLDGTKEFIKRNGEFAVNIALIENQQAILGVVAIPVTGVIYWGVQGQGAFKRVNGQDTAIQVQATPSQGMKVVASRSHRDPQTDAYLAELNQPEVVSMGSALKFMLLAEGQAHLYPRFAPTMEWDTAAPQAVLEFAGGSVMLTDLSQPLVYNKPELRNPFFIARGK